jgi:pyruvate dehydrogenase E1 component alpha subunit
MYDPDRYRDKAEVEQWRGSDPIPGLSAALTAAGALTDDEVARWQAEIEAEIEEAVAFADESPVEDVDDLTRFVTSERSEP